MIKPKQIVLPYLAAILLLVFLTAPIAQSFQYENEKLNKEKERLQKEDLFLESLIKTKEDLEKYQSLVDKIESGIPAEPSIPSIIKEIESLGLFLSEIGSFETEELEERNRLNETGMSFSVLSSRYSSFKIFLEEIERSSRLITVEKVSISPSINQDDERMKMTLDIKTYSY